MQILLPILLLAGVYFLLLRPQQQRVRRQRDLITAIGVGDRVVTAGGLIGRVVGLNDDRLQLEVADGVVLELLRLAVSRRLDESESSFDAASDSADDEVEGEYGEEEYREEGEAEPGEGEEAASADGDSGGDHDEAVEGEAAALEAPTEPKAPGAPSGPTHAAGAGGSIEEAATPAPGQDPH